MDQPTRLEDLFHAARALLPGPERAAFLDDGCGSDGDLRARLEILLRADAATDEYLPKPAAPLPERTLGEDAGTWIDRYRLLEQIGEGGFGSVWMAEQREPVKRRVALKIIKLGMDTKQVIARFEAERQALAMMNHPNIARVLDAGATETGRPFFVMELVRGLPIVEYCDREQLDMQARLELFTKVCHAIQHAHQKGIIHRDIKPSNVLVTLHDGVPVPKVIDFGIAKATNQELTTKTLFTEHRQIVGTPAYMSPEQAEMSGLDIDTRSDIYSLGVLMYELLTGTTPFSAQRLLELGYLEMMRAIREVDPERPSSRVSTQDATTSVSAAQRRTDVKKLGAILRGDLDWIVMKCLEKARTRRYDTASGLADDIQRHLEDEPVSARPPSAGYRLQKAIKRHRALALATGAVATALVLGVAGTTGGMLRANKQRGRAERAEVAAQTNADQAAYRSYVGFMLAAEAAEELGNYPEAKRLHRLCPESYRGWEWHHLDVKLNLTPALEGHAGWVFAVAFSPDGRRLVSASKDQTLRLWDVETGDTLRVLEGHTGSVLAIAFSPDGRRIVSASEDQTLRLWDAEAGVPVRVLQGHTGSVQAVAFSPDGRRIVSASRDRTVRFWSAVTGEVLRVLESPCSRLAFSSDGRRLVSSWGNSIRIRDAETGDTLNVLDGHSATVTGVAFRPDGRRIVSSSDDNSLSVWDVETGDLVRVLNGHLSYAYSPAFSPDGRYIVSTSNDETLRLWDAETGETVRVLRGHGERVLAATFSPDGRRIVSGSRDRTLRLWSLDGGLAVQVLEGPARGVFAVAFSPDGRRIASGSEDSLVRIWDAATGDVVHVRGEHADKVFSIAFSPDGRRLVSGSQDGGLQIRDAETGEPIHELEGLGNVALGLAFSADSQRIFSTSGRTITIWDSVTGEALRTWDTGDSIHGLAVRPDGRRLATVARDLVKTWNAETAELVHVLEGHTEPVFGVAYSPDGRRLVTGGWDKTARIWDAETGEPLHVLKGHAWRLNGVAFSPDGRRVASSAWDHTVRIWDAETGAALDVLEGHTGMVYQVAFSPDGRRLVSASSDGTLRIWESRLEDVRSQQRGRMRRERVRPRVSALFDEHGFLEPVLAALRADTSLSVEECQTALLMANADAARELDEQAWSRVDPDRVDRATDVALGLRLARASLQRNTTSPDLFDTLAWALFANGLHDEAIAASEQAHRLSVDQRWEHIPERMVEFQGYLKRLRAQIDQGR